MHLGVQTLVVKLDKYKARNWFLFLIEVDLTGQNNWYFRKGVSGLGGYGSWLYALNIPASLRLLQCDANLGKMSYNCNIPHIWAVSVGGLKWRQ